MSNKFNKVFGIGLSKTGTWSLNKALNILGVRSIHCPPVNELYQVLETYRAATDTPVAAAFRELDRQFPGSKFILTIREKDDWLKSAAAQFNKNGKLCNWQRVVRRKLYGSEIWEPDLWARSMEIHTQTVCEHFRNRKDDLLEMNIAKGDGWQLLCGFLKLPEPPMDFPWANKTKV